MTLAIYPLSFQPLFKEKPWGGNKISRLLKKSCNPHARIGESWEISDRGVDSTPVANGVYRGKTLHDLIGLMEHRLLGDLVWSRQFRRFPLLYKILDVESLLSVQVHPGEEYAIQHAQDRGKTEMWYILQADPGAEVVCGLKEGIGPQHFRRCLNNRHIEKALCQYPARAGESYFIPAGRIHTISPSCLIIEIQSNSDVTYRVYDWGRVGEDGSSRELHLERALDVIDFDDRESPLVEPVFEQRGRNMASLLAVCPEFTVEKHGLNETYHDVCRGRHFQVITVLEGEGMLEVQRLPGETWSLHPGDFYLLPAYLGDYQIVPKQTVSLLKSYTT